LPRKNVLGLDPGKTTGACFVKVSTTDSTFKQPYHSTELPLTQLTADTVEAMIKTYNAEEAVIEDVVKSGHLSRDKFNQIRAFDRCVQGCEKASIDYQIITPESRKRGQEPAPKSIEGKHAKDAYLIAVSTTAGGDNNATSETSPAEEEET